jgi:hypothetical protein
MHYTTWNKQPFEELLESRLKADLGSDQGEILYSRYVGFRTALNRDIFSKIFAREPSLTDHSSTHIQNIQSNILRLMGEDIQKFSSIDLYVLGLCTLFHDVGNIYARSGHKWRIPEIYKFVSSKSSSSLREMNNIRTAAEAHGGKTKGGSENTLREVPLQSDLDGNPIRLRDIACILRLADELAEGPQRRSFFLADESVVDSNNQPIIPESSWKFHEYAKITHVLIDRPNQRIGLTYEIDIQQDNEDILQYLQKIFDYIQFRITKTDIERKYARHYSDVLLPFRRITIEFNFYRNGIPCHLISGISLEDEPIVPTDANTEETSKTFFDRFPSCSPQQILHKILENQN